MGKHSRWERPGALILLLFITGFCAFAVGSAVGASWTKSEVIPVVLVKPGIVGFEPAEGNSIGNTWLKSEVKPVLLVKPGIVGFEPREGMSIGASWTRQEVLPVMLLEPSVGGFVPLRALSTGDLSALPTQELGGVRASPSVIESRIEGEFEGWEGETVVKLTNGQIWQQTEYYYRYRYAYRPQVMIFKADGGYKMKVDGIDRAVGVTRLR